MQMYLSVLQNTFVLWSSDLEEKLLEVDCGGGHRQWDFRLDEDERCAAFVVIKGRTPRLYFASLEARHVTVKVGLSAALAPRVRAIRIYSLVLLVVCTRSYGCLLLSVYWPTAYRWKAVRNFAVRQLRWEERLMKHQNACFLISASVLTSMRT